MRQHRSQEVALTLSHCHTHIHTHTHTHTHTQTRQSNMDGATLTTPKRCHCSKDIAGMALQGWHSRDGTAGMALQGWYCRDGAAGTVLQGWSCRDGTAGMVLQGLWHCRATTAGMALHLELHTNSSAPHRRPPRAALSGCHTHPRQHNHPVRDPLRTSEASGAAPSASEIHGPSFLLLCGILEISAHKEAMSI